MQKKFMWFLSLALLTTPISIPIHAQTTSPRGILAGPGISEVKTLSQNWSHEDASRYYSQPQGSYVLKYEWFLNLEQPNSEKLFRDAANIQSFGYLARQADESNPDGLPVGFAKDTKPLPNGRAENYLGMTCAACHTGHLNYGGKTYVIDGMATNGDFETLHKNLVVALDATLSQPAKFDRFASKVLGANNSTENKVKLKTDLQAARDVRKTFNDRNLPAHGATPFGPGRLDAFGAILNEVAVRFAQVPTNAAPADAPVSYPFLWDAPQHDFVQWLGSASNGKSQLFKPLVGTEYIGPLGRNTGEVFGVFGEVDASGPVSLLELKPYPSSIKRQNLIEIEAFLRTLWSPQWPAEFPPINEEYRAKGAVLYQKYCVECHQPIVRDDPNRTVVARMTDEKTDPTTAMNVVNRKGKTGVLKGRKIQPLKHDSDVFGDEAPAALMLKHLVQGAIIQSTPEILAQNKEQLDHLIDEFSKSSQVDVWGKLIQKVEDDKRALPQRFELAVGGLKKSLRGLKDKLEKDVAEKINPAPAKPVEVTINYKGRPLNGIWATAPYLHNGSIPNLDQLLKMSKERSTAVFKIGSGEFDPVNVGFRTDKGQDFDPKFKANLNTGHDYGHEDGTPFTPEERKQLIEYMKSL